MTFSLKQAEVVEEPEAFGNFILLNGRILELSLDVLVRVEYVYGMVPLLECSLGDAKELPNRSVAIQEGD